MSEVAVANKRFDSVSWSRFTDAGNKVMFIKTVEGVV